MEESIFAYGIYRKSTNLKDPVDCVGIYRTKVLAKQALVRQAEKWCEAEVGAKNFIKGQLSDHTLINKIMNNGLILLPCDNEEINVSKKMIGYLTNSAVPICFFGVFPLIDRSLEEQVIPEDSAELATKLRKLKLKKTGRRLISPPTASISEKIFSEMTDAIKKRNERLSLSEVVISEIKKEEILFPTEQQNQESNFEIKESLESNSPEITNQNAEEGVPA